MIRLRESLQTHACANPPHTHILPKAELNLRIWIRAGGEDTRETVFPSVWGLHSHLLFPQTTRLLKRSTSEQLRAHRLSRKINPDQASLWLQNYSWAPRMLSIFHTLSHCILTISHWRARISPSDPPIPWVRINVFYPCVPKVLFSQPFPIIHLWESQLACGDTYLFILPLQLHFKDSGNSIHLRVQIPRFKCQTQLNSFVRLAKTLTSILEPRFPYPTNGVRSPTSRGCWDI